MYPYAESWGDETYHYRVSVVWDERDGELNVSPVGAHIAFDDDGSGLLFPVVPRVLFPDQQRLAPADLLHVLKVLAFVARTKPDQLEGKPAHEIEAAYRRYLQRQAQADARRRKDGFPPSRE
ncbi:MAG: hypothetical protein IAE99_10205 [Rhodothermales bacterium]|nr:hypothetical protein [Rhodothermales bacterium]